MEALDIAKVAENTVQIENLEKYLNAVNEKVTVISNKMNRGTNWQLLVGFATLITLMMATLWGVSIDPVKDILEETKEHSEHYQEDFISHIRDGHPDRVFDAITLNQSNLKDDLSEITKRLDKIDLAIENLRN